MQAHMGYVHQRHELFWGGMNEVRSVLTPEQQKIFDQDFTRPWEAHHGHGGHDQEENMPPEQGAPQPPPPPPAAPSSAP
jgi:hypothetical protein